MKITMDFQRRWRDLNSRTGCPIYRISSADPSATWVHLQKYRKAEAPPSCVLIVLSYFNKPCEKMQELS